MERSYLGIPTTDYEVRGVTGATVCEESSLMFRLNDTRTCPTLTLIVTLDAAKLESAFTLYHG